MKKNIFILLLCLLALVIAVGDFYLWQIWQSQYSTKASISQGLITQLQSENKTLTDKISTMGNDLANINNANHDVIIKVNKNDKNKTDIYVKNLESNEEYLYVTLPIIAGSEEYLSGEYHNGNVYLIKSYLKDNMEIKRELWKFDQTGKGSKLYAGSNFFDYTVSPDEHFFAIIDSENNSTFISVFKDLKSYKKINIPYELIEVLLGFANDNKTLWAMSSPGSCELKRSFVKLDIETTEMKKYDFSECFTSGNVFNPDNGEVLLVTSFANGLQEPMTDQEIEKAIEQNNSQDSIWLYNLNDNSRKQIFSQKSEVCGLDANWVDDNTIEYNSCNFSKPTRYYINN